MAKVRIKKHCKIKGVPATPGAIHDVPEARAKALTDNGYAEAIDAAKKPEPSSDEANAIVDEAFDEATSDEKPKKTKTAR